MKGQPAFLAAGFFAAGFLAAGFLAAGFFAAPASVPFVDAFVSTAAARVDAGFAAAERRVELVFDLRRVPVVFRAPTRDGVDDDLGRAAAA